MAARRLLIVMLILLGISSVIAFVVPEPDRNDSPSGESLATGSSGTSGSSGTTGTTGATGGTGDSGPALAAGSSGDDDGAAARVDGVARETVVLGPGEVERIRAEPGSRIILTVKSKYGSDVEIEGLGLTGFADPYAPAVFDLILPPGSGNYSVKAPGEKPGAVIVASS